MLFDSAKVLTPHPQHKIWMLNLLDSTLFLFDLFSEVEFWIPLW